MQPVPQRSHDPANDNEGQLLRLPPDARHRLARDAMAILWIVLLGAAAYWVIDGAIANARQQECLARGYSYCARIVIPEKAP